MKNTRVISLLMALIMLFGLTAGTSITAFAETTPTEAITAEAEAQEDTEAPSTGAKAIAAAIAVGLAAALGAIGMGIAIAKSVEGISRQPEASGKINGAMMLGMVFIETLVIYALIVAILIIFVL
ncbi:MAG: ATP synthase F0 subunit C [Eubacteriales bacterium]|nr:ATP synthase F0 subunit C [Eubacteriales bacterium]